MTAIAFDAYLEDSQMIAAINRIERHMMGLTDTVEMEGKKMDSTFKNLAAGMAAYFSADMVSGFVGDIVSVRGEFQKFEAVLTNSFGSTDKAKESMAMLADVASTTPFQLDAITDSYIKLVNQGFTPTRAEIIKMGDLASSTGKGFDQLVEATLDAQNGEFERLKEFGIKASVSGDQVTMIFKGQKTTIDNTAESMRAYLLSLGDMKGISGSMAAISQTMEGQVSNLKDSWTNALNEMGADSEEVLSGMIGGAKTLVDNYDTVIGVIGTLITAYGAQKAATMFVTAVDSAETAVKYTAQANELSKLISVEQQARVSKLGLTQGSIEHVAAIRLEVAENIEALKVESEATAMRVSSAQAEHKVALQRALDSKIMVSQREMELSLANLGGNARQIELAEKSLLQAQEERHVAVKARKATADTLAIAQSKASAASSALETVSTNANTAVQTANTASTNLLTMAKTRLSAAMAKLDAAIMANPYAIATAGIIALGYAVYQLATYETQAEKAQKELNTALVSEKISLDQMFEKLKQAKQGTEEWGKAKQDIVDKYGQYDSTLVTELNSVSGVAKAYDKLTIAIGNAAKTRLKDKYTQAASDQAAEVIGDRYNRIRETLVDKLGAEKGGQAFDQIKKYVDAGKKLELKGGIWDEKKSAMGLQTVGAFVREQVAQIRYQNAELNKEVVKYDSIFKTATGATGSGKTTDKAFTDANALQNQISQSEANLEKLRSNKKKLDAEAIEKETKNLEALKKQYTELTGDSKTYKNTTPKKEKTELELYKETLDKKKKEYEDYENWVTAFGEESANSRYAKLLQSGKTYEEYLKSQRTAIAGTDGNKKLSSNESGKVTLINTALDEKSGFDKFKEQLDGIKSSSKDAYEQLEKLTNLDMSKLSEGDKVKASALQTTAATELKDGIQKDLLSKYATTEDQKKKIMESSNKEIAMMEQLGWTDRIKVATEERNKLLAELDLSKFETSNKGLIDLVFGDTSDMPTDQILQAIDRIKGKMATVDAKTQNSDGYKQLTKDLSGLENQVKDNEKNPFAKLKRSYKDYTDALKNGGDASNAFKNMAGSASGALDMTKGMFDSVVDGMKELGIAGDEQTQELLGNISGAISGASQLAMGIATGNPLSIVQGTVGLITNGIKIFDGKSRQIERDIKKHQQAVKDLEYAYNDLKRAVDDALGTGAYDAQKNAISNLQQQKKEYEELLRLEQSKKGKDKDQGKIDEYRKQLQQLGYDIADEQKQLTEELIQTNVKDFAQSLADSLTDAFSQGESAAKAFDKTVNDVMLNVVKNAFKKNVIETALTPLINQMTGAMADYNISPEEMAAIQAVAGQVKGNVLAGMEQYKSMISSLGLSDSSNSLEGAMKGITSEQASLLAGQFIALRVNSAEGLRLNRDMLAVLQQIATNTYPISEIRDLIKSAIYNNDLRSKGL